MLTLNDVVDQAQMTMQSCVDPDDPSVDFEAVERYLRGFEIARWALHESGYLATTIEGSPELGAALVMLRVVRNAVGAVEGGFDAAGSIDDVVEKIGYACDHAAVGTSRPSGERPEV